MSQGKTETKNVARASDYKFVDPTGQFQGQLDNLGNRADVSYNSMLAAMDPNASFNAFMGQSPSILNMTTGATMPLEQSLMALANRQAEAGTQAAAQQFNNMGAGRSGAANRAIGEAAYTPFANANAQIAQQRLGLAGNLLGQQLGNLGALQNQSVGAFGNVFNNALGLQTGMAQETGGMMAPNYQSTYKPGFWDRMQQGAQFAANIATPFLLAK